MAAPSKTIRVEIGRPASLAEREALERIGGRFEEEDFRLECDGDVVRVSLRALDVSAFEAAVAEAIRQGGLSPKESAPAKVLAAVKRIGSYGVRGGRRVFVGFADERKVKSRAEKIAKRGGPYYSLGNEFSESNVVLPAAFENAILCGDSEEILKSLPDNCIDLVVTSPPYNFGLDYDSAAADGAPWQHYFEKIFRVFGQCIRVLKYGGRIAVNVEPLFSDYIPSHHIISNFFLSRGLIWKGEILWEKNNYNCKYTAWGSWKSPSNPYLKYTWEFIEIFAKGTLKKAGDARDADITAEDFKKWVLARWSIAPERRMGEFGHPAMFPEELVRRLLLLFSFRGDVVLDPFNGVGTATTVAAALERRFLGLDISEDYCRRARERLTAGGARVQV